MSQDSISPVTSTSDYATSFVVLLRFVAISLIYDLVEIVVFAVGIGVVWKYGLAQAVPLLLKDWGSPESLGVLTALALGLFIFMVKKVLHPGRRYPIFIEKMLIPKLSATHMVKQMRTKNNYWKRHPEAHIGRSEFLLEKAQ